MNNILFLVQKIYKMSTVGMSRVAKGKYPHFLLQAHTHTTTPLSPVIYAETIE
jgi:hypothetical protein